MGSGHGLLDAPRGEEINSHDVVVRVNRIFHPSLNYGDPNLSTQYLGNRTDIYFLDRCGAGKEDDDEDEDGFRYLLLGGGEGQCHSYPVHPRDCPFRALVYRGNTDRSNGDDCVGETNDIGPLADKARRSHIPIGIQNDRSVDWVVDLIGYPATNPTTGFHAFLTLALSCKTLDLYGYNGTGSADGHIAQLGWGNHNIVKEHQIIGSIIQHTSFGDTSFPQSMEEAWSGFAPVSVVC